MLRPAHMRSIRTVAGHLEREIGLHTCAHVKAAIVIEWPAAMFSLNAPQVDSDFLLQLRIRGLAAIVPQQDIFGRNRCVGL